MPLDCSAQTSHITMKIMAMAKVMFKSALPPRSQGRVTSKPLAVSFPQPMVPTPGTKPNQLVKQIKMKMVAKNQKDFLTSSTPTISSRKSCRPSTSSSQKFCAPRAPPSSVGSRAGQRG